MSKPPLNLDDVDWDDDEDPPPPPEEPEPEIVSNRGKLQDRVNPLQVRRRELWLLCTSRTRREARAQKGGLRTAARQLARAPLSFLFVFLPPLLGVAAAACGSARVAAVARL